MKFASAGRSRSASSMARSSASTSDPLICGNDAFRSDPGVASSVPRLNSASCVHASQASRRSVRALVEAAERSSARAMPIALESSSTVPYVSMRSAFFLTREPPIKPRRSVVAGAGVDTRVFRHCSNAYEGLMQSPGEAGPVMSEALARNVVKEIPPKAADLSAWYTAACLKARAGLVFAGAGLRRSAPLRVRLMGELAEALGRTVQGNRTRKRLLPALHSRELARARGGARRRLRARGGVGDAGWQRKAHGASRDPADVRGDHRRDVRAVDRVVSRPADSDQSVGQRRALGEGDAPVPAHDGVSVAGGAHRARVRVRGARGDAANSRTLSRLRGERCRDTGLRGKKKRERTLPRRGRDVCDRGADARRQGAAIRDVARSRSEFCQGV